jgi:hypothetical protein
VERPSSSPLATCGRWRRPLRPAPGASPLKQLSLSGGLLNSSRRAICGNYIGSRADTAQMLAFSSKHGITAIVEVMPLARVTKAIERVRRRDVAMGLVLEKEHASETQSRLPEEALESWVGAHGIHPRVDSEIPDPGRLLVIGALQPTQPDLGIP